MLSFVVLYNAFMKTPKIPKHPLLSLKVYWVVRTGQYD